jgi:hypothetical protein
MFRVSIFLAACALCTLFLTSQDNLLKIDVSINPKHVAQGSNVVLKLHMTPQNGCRISSHPELVIRFNDNDWLVFTKMFFGGSELNLPTSQEKDGVYVSIDRDIEIPFKIKDNAPLGTIELSGEVTFTALFQGSCFVKTFQVFSVPLQVRKKGSIRGRF